MQNVDHLCKDIFENGFSWFLDQIFNLIGQGVVLGDGRDPSRLMCFLFQYVKKKKKFKSKNIHVTEAD